MYLSILCYKLVCLVDKIVFRLIDRGKESVEFVKSISKKAPLLHRSPRKKILFVFCS